MAHTTLLGCGMTLSSQKTSRRMLEAGHKQQIDSNSSKQPGSYCSALHKVSKG